MKFLKKIRDVGFIGRTLSRFKIGMGYYAVIMSSITAVMTFKTAFPSLEFWYIFLLVPIMVIGTVLLGYYLDKSNISTLDMRTSNEISHRFLLTSDKKSQEFQLIQTEVIIEALAALSQKKDVDIELLHKKYQNYYQKWKDPVV